MYVRMRREGAPGCKAPRAGGCFLLCSCGSQCPGRALLTAGLRRYAVYKDRLLRAGGQIRVVPRRIRPLGRMRFFCISGVTARLEALVKVLKVG